MRDWVIAKSVSVAPTPTVTSVSQLISRCKNFEYLYRLKVMVIKFRKWSPLKRTYLFASCCTKGGWPALRQYWLAFSSTERFNASFTNVGVAQSGKPWPRLMAFISLAKGVNYIVKSALVSLPDSICIVMCILPLAKPFRHWIFQVF